METTAGFLRLRSVARFYPVPFCGQVANSLKLMGNLWPETRFFIGP